MMPSNNRKSDIMEPGNISRSVQPDVFDDDFYMEAIETGVCWLQESGCILPVGNQGLSRSCYAYPIIRTMYAEQLLHGHGQDPCEGSTQELIEHLYKFTYNEVPTWRGNPNTFINGFTYVKHFGVHPTSRYPHFDECRLVIDDTEYPVNKIFIDDFKSIEYDNREEILYQLSKRPLCGVIILTQAIQYWNSEDKIYAPSQEDMEEVIQNMEMARRMKLPYETPFHAVTLVGFGQKGGVEYFLCQNSEGSDWGHDGYFKVQQNAVGFISYPIKTHVRRLIVDPKENVDVERCGFVYLGTDTDPMEIELMRTDTDLMEIDVEE